VNPPTGTLVPENLNRAASGAKTVLPGPRRRHTPPKPAWQSFGQADRVTDVRPTETAKRMTGPECRTLSVGSRVCWRDYKNDQATVTETSWSGETLKWDNRSQQSVLHNDVEAVGIVSKK
jgi:hypothetical protein